MTIEKQIEAFRAILKRLEIEFIEKNGHFAYFIDYKDGDFALHNPRFMSTHGSSGFHEMETIIQEVENYKGETSRMIAEFEYYDLEQFKISGLYEDEESFLKFWGIYKTVKTEVC